MAARAIGKIIAMTLAKTIPGHLAAPGKLSDTHELIRVQTIEIMLIWSCELGLSNLGVRMTYTKRNDVDLGNGKYGWLSRGVVALDPEDHCCLLARCGGWEERWYGSLDPPDWPTWARKAKNMGTFSC